MLAFTALAIGPQFPSKLHPFVTDILVYCDTVQNA